MSIGAEDIDASGHGSSASGQGSTSTFGSSGDMLRSSLTLLAGNLTSGQALLARDLDALRSSSNPVMESDDPGLNCPYSGSYAIPRVAYTWNQTIDPTSI